MNSLKQYIIFFLGLKEGKHDFTFTIDGKLFSDFGNSDIDKADIAVDVVLEKKLNHLEFSFNIEGTITSTCDRCLSPLELEINDFQKLYVNFGDITSDVTDIDDTMILSRTEDKIDLAKHFYDYILLNLPIQKIHQDDENGESTCDEEMLRKLDEYEQKSNEKKDTDPRWDKLKNLLN